MQDDLTRIMHQPQFASVVEKNLRITERFFDNRYRSYFHSMRCNTCAVRAGRYRLRKWRF